MRRIVLALALMFLVSGAGADPIVVGTTPNPAAQGLVLEEFQYLAQAFAMSGGMSSVNLTFFQNPGGPFLATLFVTNAIGTSATAANILATTTFTVPAGISPTVASIPVSLNLPGGETYFIVISTTAPLPANAAWVMLGTPVTIGVGAAFFSQSQNVGFPVGSNFVHASPIPGTSLAFEITGTGTAVPEPASGLLLLIGVGLLARRVRSFRRTHVSH